jgi:hypothetical protein
MQGERFIYRCLNVDCHVTACFTVATPYVTVAYYKVPFLTILPARALSISEALQSCFADRYEIDVVFINVTSALIPSLSLSLCCR